MLIARELDLQNANADLASMLAEWPALGWIYR